MPAFIFATLAAGLAARLVIERGWMRKVRFPAKVTESLYAESCEKPAYVLAIVLAGGEGKRLFPLTEDRAKPAVPFGGSYRLIDFVLSNLVNAGFLKIAVL